MANRNFFLEESPNLTCSLCEQRPSTMFCTCFGHKTFLCLEDLPRHYEKWPNVPHPILPLSALEAEKAPDYMNQVQKRYQTFAQGQAELLANLEFVDKCCQEYSETMDEFVAYVKNSCAESVKQVQVYKTWLEGEIQEAINEVKNTLSQEAPELTKPLSIALRKYTPGSLGLFQYRLHIEEIKNMVQGIFAFQHNESMLPLPHQASDLQIANPPTAEDTVPVYVQQIIAVLEHEVKRFDPSSTQWSTLCTLSGKISVSSTSSSTFIDSNQIFVCGGSGSSGSCICHIDQFAYVLETSGSILPKPSMKTGRWGHGLIYDWKSRTIYVFGGFNFGGERYVALKSAEKLIITAQDWQPLPDMTEARRIFNPCLHESIIYLCGGRDVRSVESYDILRNTFTLLPELKLVEGLPCAAVIDSGNLVVVSTKHVSRWNYEQKGFSVKGHKEYSPWSRCTPVVSGGVLYSVNLDDKMCRGVNLETGALECEVPFI